MASEVSATIRPEPGTPVNWLAYSRMSSHPARVLTAKWRSKDSTVVSMISLSTDSQCPSTRAPTGPRSRSTRAKTCRGASASSKFASTGHARAPAPASSPASSCAAPASGPHGIRAS